MRTPYRMTTDGGGSNERAIYVQRNVTDLWCVTTVASPWGDAYARPGGRRVNGVYAMDFRWATITVAHREEKAVQRSTGSA